jgi:hypothetical protein
MPISVPFAEEEESDEPTKAKATPVDAKSRPHFEILSAQQDTGI